RGPRADLMKAYFDQMGKRRELELFFSFERTALGTIGPIKQITGLGETFLVLNGDVLTTLSFKDLLDTHRRKGCVATLAVHKRQIPMDYGIVEVTPDARIVGHREKPSLEVTVGMGIYVFNRRVVDFVPDGKFDIPDLIHALLDAGESIAAYQSDDYWMDIGRPDDYEIAHRDYTASPERFVPADKR